jgi:hypothetical protein
LGSADWSVDHLFLCSCFLHFLNTLTQKEAKAGVDRSGECWNGAILRKFMMGGELKPLLTSDNGANANGHNNKGINNGDSTSYMATAERTPSARKEDEECGSTVKVTNVSPFAASLPVPSLHKGEAISFQIRSCRLPACCYSYILLLVAHFFLDPWV